MLQPRKLKYRKPQIERLLKDKIALKGSKLVYGIVGLKSLETKLITNKQIEACLNEIKRQLKKKGRYWLRIFPHFPKTKKPPETRMGGGKGDIENYVVHIKPGTIIFELDGPDKELLKNVLKKVAYKLPFKVKIIEK